MSRTLALEGLLALAAALALGACNSAHSSAPAVTSPDPVQKAASLLPPGPNDLVVFTANEKPTLYRIVGDRVEPWGGGRFQMPQGVVADPKRRCFYVLDRPASFLDKIRVWKIAEDGTATVIGTSNYTNSGGPMADPVSAGLDAQGRVIVCDTVVGLYVVQADGTLAPLAEGQKKSAQLTAVCPGRDGATLVVSSYRYDVGGSPSTPNFIWQNQGGLYSVDLGKQPSPGKLLVANRQPGGQEYDTYWRHAAQVLLDSAGRILVADNGSSKRIGGRTSVINGGLYVLHPDGKLEELTAKGTGGTTTPLRRPAGVAEWDSKTYLVADPELYIEGGAMEGPGGLCLLGLDGSRDPRWKLGWQIKPTGVAILRRK